MPLKSVEIFDVGTDDWKYSEDLLSEDLSLPDKRAATCAVVHDNTIFVFGGSGDDGVPLKSGFSLTLNEDGTELSLSLPR